MGERIALLPGWGFAPSVMQPLAQALGEAYSVRIYALPALDNAEPEAWLQVLDQHIEPNSWLLGWSLGGMLATQLAARRGGDCPGLITLASNARFVANGDWPQAMPNATFETFAQAFAVDPRATLKRFTQLCAQGAAQPRQLARTLQAHVSDGDIAWLSFALQLLGRLDTRPALRDVSARCLHLLAADDALLPKAAASSLQALGGAVEVLSDCGHAMVLEQTAQLAQRLNAFIREPRDE